MINTDDFLAPYGVLGMKWGVRKDRLEGRNRKRLAKAQKINIKASQIQSEIDKIQSQKTTWFNKGRQNRKIKSLSKDRDRNLKDAEAKMNGRLTSTQKKVLIGAAVVGVLVGTRIVTTNKNSGEFNRLKSDPYEEFWDPFISVDKTTGETTDFSILEMESPKEILDLLVKAKE